MRTPSQSVVPGWVCDGRAGPFTKAAVHDQTTWSMARRRLGASKLASGRSFAHVSFPASPELGLCLTAPRTSLIKHHRQTRFKVRQSAAQRRRERHSD